MAPIWIEASLAVDIAANGGSKTAAQYTLCERAHAGLIRTLAKSLFVNEVRQTVDTIPCAFWWANGHEALEQNWVTGDFSTSIDRSTEVKAFGVRFALDDVLDILPFEQRALIARRHSVVGNPDWVSAKEAVSIVLRKEYIPFEAATTKLIEWAKLGFVTARAVEKRSGRKMQPHHDTFEREWDIPVWFWREYCSRYSASQNWDIGRFSGQSAPGPNELHIELTGVHFLKVTIPGYVATAEGDAFKSENMPPLPAAELERWWRSMAKTRDNLSQDQLLVLIRAKYPENHIARDRIRELASDRKRGKRPLGD